MKSEGISDYCYVVSIFQFCLIFVKMTVVTNLSKILSQLPTVLNFNETITY